MYKSILFNFVSAMERQFVCNVKLLICLIAKQLYKNCLNLDFLLKVKQNLHLKLCELQEKHNHFLCKIINEKYQYSIKSVFSGEDIFFDVKKALTEWEETKTEEICRGKVSVIVEDYFKENRFFKIS